MLYLLVIIPLFSLISFTLYGLDKSKAQRNVRRIPERVLLGWDLIGGWIGGYIAQRYFRHKIVKRSYQIRYWLCVIVNIVAIICFFIYYPKVALDLFSG